MQINLYCPVHSGAGGGRGRLRWSRGHAQNITNCSENLCSNFITSSNKMIFAI